MDTPNRLLKNYLEKHTEEAIYQIENLGYKEIASFMESVEPEIGSVVLAKLDPFRAGRVVERMDLDTSIKLLEGLSIPVDGIILRHIDESIRNEIIRKLPEEIAGNLIRFMNFDPQTVGAFADPGVTTLPANIKVSDGLERLRNNEAPTPAHVFVLGTDYRLEGLVEIKDLVMTDGEKMLSTVLKKNPPKVSADTAIKDLRTEDVLDHTFSSYAVIDSEGHFLGILDRNTLLNGKQGIGFKDMHATQASSELGQLFRIGLSGLFKSALEIDSSQQNPED